MSEANVLIGFTKWLLKWLGIIVAGLIVLVLIAVAGFWSWNWWSYERHKAKIDVQILNTAAPEQVKSSKVMFRGKPASAPCIGTDEPIFILYENNTSQVVEHISIDFEAHLPGQVSKPDLQDFCLLRRAPIPNIIFDRLLGLIPVTTFGGASVGRIGRDTSSGVACALLRYN